MSEKKIKPALTAEGWATELSSRDFYVKEARGLQGLPSLDGAGHVCVTYDGGYAAQQVNKTKRHALAALALYGQPFGLTHEMADTIDRAVAGGYLSESDLRTLRTTISVIRALLPAKDLPRLP